MFVGKRVMLRKMTEQDILKYHEWKNNLDIMRSTSPYLDMYSFEETKQFVMDVILNNQNSKSYMIVDNETHNVIGITSLVNIDWKNRNAECIIDIGEKDYWGKGIGKESLSMLLQYAFLELNLNRVGLKVYSFNERAINLYNNLGFVKEGEIRQEIYRDGSWHNTIIMGLLAQEYIAELK